MATNGSSGRSLLDSVTPLLDRVRSVKPGAAKESATRSAATTKDLVQLSIGYVKQETKQPLQGLARYLKFGLPAAVLIANGLVLLLLGALRGIQAAFAYERVTTSAKGVRNDRGPLSGNLSWAPYLLTVVVCLLALGLIALAAKRALRPTNQGNR